jgi:hypothetical protein
MRQPTVNDSRLPCAHCPGPCDPGSPCAAAWDGGRDCHGRMDPAKKQLASQRVTPGKRLDRDAPGLGKRRPGLGRGRPTAVGVAQGQSNQACFRARRLVAWRAGGGDRGRRPQGQSNRACSWARRLIGGLSRRRRRSGRPTRGLVPVQPAYRFMCWACDSPAGGVPERRSNQPVLGQGGLIASRAGSARAALRRPTRRLFPVSRLSRSNQPALGQGDSLLGEPGRRRSGPRQAPCRSRGAEDLVFEAAARCSARRPHPSQSSSGAGPSGAAGERGRSLSAPWARS